MRAFSLFLCCWWGVSGSGKNEDFLWRAFKVSSRSLPPFTVPLWVSHSSSIGSSSQPGPAAFKDPKEQLSSICPFPRQPFLLPSLLIPFHSCPPLHPRLLFLSFFFFFILLTSLAGALFLFCPLTVQNPSLHSFI